MSNGTITRRVHEASGRFETILHLGSMLVEPDAPCGALNDFFVEEEIEAYTDLLEALPEQHRAQFQDYATFDADDLAEALWSHQAWGFIVRAATPIRQYDNPNRYSWSWGAFYTKWIYAETLEGAVGKAIEWAATRNKADKEKAA